MELIIYLGALGALIQYVPLWDTLLTKLRLNIKPFNCPLCFTWWASLGYTLVSGTDFMTSIFISAGAAILAELLWRKLNTY